MIKWHTWWFDLLLAGLLALTIGLVVTDLPVWWALLAPGLVLFLAGYAIVRPRLALRVEKTTVPSDYAGAALIALGLALGSYADSTFAQLLCVACPVVWLTLSGLRSAITGNLAMIALTALAILGRSTAKGTIATDWPYVVGAALTAMVFTIMIGSMVSAAMGWGAERAELLADLQASQADLAESYQRLLAGETETIPAEESCLSAREIEVLSLASLGCTNREIGLRLYISPATVKTHMEHILTKLGATTRTQAVLLAHQAGLLPMVQ